MGDEKRHVDHLEEAAHKAEADLRDDLEKAVEFEKADVAETHREWHDQLHNDHAELVADVARDKEEIREALDDARHPERIVHAAEESSPTPPTRPAMSCAPWSTRASLSMTLRRL